MSAGLPSWLCQCAVYANRGTTRSNVTTTSRSCFNSPRSPVCFREHPGHQLTWQRTHRWSSHHSRARSSVHTSARSQAARRFASSSAVCCRSARFFSRHANTNSSNASGMGPRQRFEGGSGPHGHVAPSSHARWRRETRSVTSRANRRHSRAHRCPCGRRWRLRRIQSHRCNKGGRHAVGMGA